MTLRLLSALALTASAPAILSMAPQPAQPSPEAEAQLERLTIASQMASACGSAMADKGKAKGPMPLIAGLAPIHVEITTGSREAQLYFDQGMALLYGFEFEKAERSFAEAAKRDPACAMCKWGQALAIGPYMNSGPSGVARIADAYRLTTEALALPGITDKERALIAALRQRYEPHGPAKEKGVHEIVFANAMQAVSDRWPDDDMIMVLTAEAAMNVSPWNYWEADHVTPRPWGARAIRLIETVLARNPHQPQAQHLYIHVTEASSAPGRAEKAADMLGTSSPASAHLVHMPSHTYYRIGRFVDSVSVNVKAIEVDEAMARRLGEDPKYYGYFTHHTDFILSAAEQMGDRAAALKAATDLEASITPDDAIKSPWLQGRLSTALQARAQFAASPAEMLAIAEPNPRLHELRQLWRALRAEALGRAGQKAEAMREIKAMRTERQGISLDRDFRPLLKLAEAIALARIAEGSGDTKAAMRQLQTAAAIERTFDYNEPPLWHQPVEAAIGALLLRTGDARGAKAAFERALIRRPGSAWVLGGLAQADAALGDAEAGRRSLTQFRKAWAGGSTQDMMARL